MLSQITTQDQDACLTCGACCAHFRVTFYWAEGEILPQDFIEPINTVYSCMKGTNQKNSRCIALIGEIGEMVSCGVYSARSSTCKEVQVGDEQCLKARKAYNLIPLIEIDLPDSSNDEDYDQVC